MTNIETINALEERKKKIISDLDDAYERMEDLESEMEDERFEINRLEGEKEAVEKQIEAITLNLNPYSKEAREIYTKRFLEPAENREDLNGQFKIGSQFGLCNGYAFAVHNEPIENILFVQCSESIFEYIRKTKDANKTRIEFRTSDIDNLKDELDEHRKTVRIGNSLYDYSYICEIRSILQLDDSAEYYAIEVKKETDIFKRCYGLYIVTKNNEFGYILPVHEPK